MEKYAADAVSLACAVLQVRGSATIVEMRKALEDAHWVLYPKPTDDEYKSWQFRNGETPTTKEEDTAKAADVAERMRRHAASLASRLA